MNVRVLNAREGAKERWGALLLVWSADGRIMLIC